MSTSEPALLVEQDGHVLRLTINRPEKRNAINEAVMIEMTEVLQGIDHTSPTRVIVLTGAGDKAFCSGADLGGDQQTFGPSYAKPTTVFADLLRTAYRLPVPMIARVNGYCLAGGVGLLAVCDLAVAAPYAKLGLPEVKVGLFPMQVAALVKDIIPPRIFAELAFTGEMVSAEYAKEIGLINHVATEGALDEKIDWLVSRIADKSPTGIRLGKHAMRSIGNMGFDEAMAHMEAQISIMPMTEDAKEGLAAFRKKRAPNWTGR